MSALGQKRTNRPGPKSTFVRCYSNSGQTRVRLECPLCANNDRFAPQKSSELFTLGFPASCHSVMSDAANNGQC
jgi:hypothetical protein